VILRDTVDRRQVAVGVIAQSSGARTDQAVAYPRNTLSLDYPIDRLRCAITVGVATQHFLRRWCIVAQECGKRDAGMRQPIGVSPTRKLL